MKKSTVSIVVILVIVVVAIIVLGGSHGTNQPSASGTPSATASPVVAVTETHVSSRTSQYKNAELGFSVNYPTAWEAENTDTGVSFIMPIDQNQVSTIAKLQADIGIMSGKCAFPPVTTIKDRGTLAVGSATLNMISMTNTVQGRSYFDRMYSLQKDSVCYIFTFASIALSPESKKLTGSNLTQAQNNNKAIVNTADSDFTAMVKSFTFVQGPQGQDESTIH